MTSLNPVMRVEKQIETIPSSLPEAAAKQV